VPDFDCSDLPAPGFAVLDIVRISHNGNPELSDDLATVNEVRYYRDYGYRYGVSNDELGGLLDDSMLAGTGERDTIDRFWNPPLRKGDVVEISTDYPKTLTIRKRSGTDTSQRSSTATKASTIPTESPSPSATTGSEAASR